jgi:hypothetical protein
MLHINLYEFQTHGPPVVAYNIFPFFSTFLPFWILAHWPCVDLVDPNKLFPYSTYYVSGFNNIKSVG